MDIHKSSDASSILGIWGEGFEIQIPKRMEREKYESKK